MKTRIKILKITYFIILFAIILRLFYWQVIRSDDLTARAEEQHLVSSAIDAPRGQIFSADGYLLASNKPTFLLYGLPKVIKDHKGTASKLAEIILAQNANPSVDQSQKMADYISLRNNLENKLSADLYWVTLQRGLGITVKNQIEKMNIEGVGFEEGLARFYPEASSAAHLLGLVGSDPLGKPTGYSGIEGFYNGELKGVSGSLTQERDAQGNSILIGRFLQKEAENGHDLVLNVDRTVQHIVEDKLKQGIEKYGAKSASAVVMDPKTGGILALASYPNYDPNSFADFPQEYFKDPLVSDTYEPGSTFKVLVMAAALNEHLVTPDTSCNNCSEPVKIGQYSIRTWNNQYKANITTTETIIHSDNTGMVFVGRKLGMDLLYKYIQDFGFGNPTQVDLQNEVGAELRPKKDWREIDLATASFGQGIAVTQMQMIRAVAAIANGGNLMEPHIVKSIKSKDKTITIDPRVVRNVISSQAANLTKEMMVKAIEQGEAKFYAIHGFKIAGKTGTAQIPVGGSYDPDKTNASFVGFAPADNPKFVILVRYKEPSSSIYGSETAAPTFFAIARDLFSYYGIVPTQ